MTNQKKFDTKTIAIGAVLTAIVIVLQYIGGAIPVGTFTLSFVLVPIVIGAALCGPAISTWLGFVFGAVVLFRATDTAAFIAYNAVGTYVTVLLKGALAGLVSGLVYKACLKFGRMVAVIAAAVVCPIVNTGTFILGCYVFFYGLFADGAAADGHNVFVFLILSFIGLNFVLELAVNLVLAPTIVKILNIVKKDL